MSAQSRLLAQWCECPAECDQGYVTVKDLHGQEGVDECEYCIGADELEIGPRSDRIRSIWTCEDCEKADDMVESQPHMIWLDEAGAILCAPCAERRGPAVG